MKKIIFVGAIGIISLLAIAGFASAGNEKASVDDTSTECILLIGFARGTGTWDIDSKFPYYYANITEVGQQITIYGITNDGRMKIILDDVGDGIHGISYFGMPLIFKNRVNSLFLNSKIIDV